MHSKKFHLCNATIIFFVLVCIWEDLGFVCSGEMGDKCKAFCDSERPEGSYNAFQASCGHPEYNIRFEYHCLFSCATNECPGNLCPDGNYVECPEKSRPTEKTQNTPYNEGESSSNDLSVLIWPILGVVVLLGAVAAFVGIYCCVKNRNRMRQNPYMQQQFQPQLTPSGGPQSSTMYSSSNVTSKTNGDIQKAEGDYPYNQQQNANQFDYRATAV